MITSSTVTYWPWAAPATNRIRLGPEVTPVPRRRPRQLAREIATLDRLSGGRIFLGVGLGNPIENEYGRFGEPTDPNVLAGLLDEGLKRSHCCGPVNPSPSTAST